MITITKQDGRSIDRDTLEYIRMNSIKRWLAGEGPQDIIRGTGFCHTTIYKWINLYKQGGWAALASTKAPGAAPKLSESQLEALKVMIIGKTPADYGLEFDLWTRQIVAELIKKEFDIELGLTQVGKLLAKLEITPQKPVREAREQDPQEVREWKEEKFPAIVAGAKENNAEIFFLMKRASASTTR